MNEQGISKVQFDKRMSNICKGLAIILMIIHHVFPNMEGYGLKIGNVWVINQIAIMGELCVSIFLFLSGYGLVQSAKKKFSVISFYRKRFASIYINYWLVFIIFIGIGFIFYRDILNMFITQPYTPEVNMLLSFFGIQYFCGAYMGINPSWWFISQIILLYLLFPIFYKLIKSKVGKVILCVLAIIMLFVRSYLSFGRLYISLLYVPAFIVGMLFSELDLINYLGGLLKKVSVVTFWYIVLIGLTVFRIKAGLNTELGIQTDCLLAPMYCISVYQMIAAKGDKEGGFIFRLLQFLGKHSFNIYLIHLFITNMYTTPYIYGLNDPVIMVTVTILICLPFSILIERIKKFILSPKKREKNECTIDIRLKGIIAAALILAVMIVYCVMPLLIKYFSLNKKYNILVVFGLLIVITILLILLIKGLLPKIILCTKTDDSSENRSAGLDIIRVLACLLVILIHYFASVGYYSQPAVGIIFFLATMVRWFAMCCCPLFMILSGYCLYNRVLDKKYKDGIVKLLRNYVVICIICLIVHKNTSLTFIKNLINMSEMWYVGMYFGIALLCPFLNILWKNIGDKKYKNYFIAVLITISMLSSITDSWWTGFWNGLYPITYYYLGMWLKESKIVIRKLPGTFLLLIVVGLQSLYTYFHANGSVFDWLDFGGYSSAYNCVPTMIISVLLFLLLKDIRIKNKPVLFGLRNISRNSLEIYLSVCLILGTYIFTFVWSNYYSKIGVVGCGIVLLILELLAGTVFGVVLNGALDLIQKVIKGKEKVE